MSRRRLLIISRHQAKLLLGNPGALVIFVIIPLLTMVIMKSTQKSALLGAGYRHVNGAEQAVPGFTVMFAFFWLVFVGRTFFAEHCLGHVGPPADDGQHNRGRHRQAAALVHRDHASR